MSRSIIAFGCHDQPDKHKYVQRIQPKGWRIQLLDQLLLSGLACASLLDFYSLNLQTYSLFASAVNVPPTLQIGRRGGGRMLRQRRSICQMTF